MTGGHDPDNRKDFTGGWREDKINKFTRTGRTADEQKMFEWTQKWIKLRRENRALKFGRTVDLIYDNDIYIFERIDKGFTDFDYIVPPSRFIVAVNRSDREKKVTISPEIEKPGFGLCFKNGVGMENPHDKIEFPEKAARLTINKVPCFNTKQDTFSFKVPAQSAIGFSIYRFP